MFRILLAALLFAFCGSLPAADNNPSAYTLGVAADRADGIYRRGEPVTFTISIALKGMSISDAKLRWTLTKDGKEIGQSGETKLTDGKAIVTGTLDGAGFLQCCADITQPESAARTYDRGMIGFLCATLDALQECWHHDPRPMITDNPTA